MEQSHRNAIRKSWTILVRSFTNDQIINIVDHLTERDILTMGMRETIECEQGTTAKVRTLLTIIQKRGPHAFQCLVDSMLQSDAGHTAEILLSNVNLPSLERPVSTIREPDEVQQNTVPIVSESTEVSDHVTCTICMDKAISSCPHPFDR